MSEIRDRNGMPVSRPPKPAQRADGAEPETCGDCRVGDSEARPLIVLCALHAAAPKLVAALSDCVEALARLEDAEGAYRVTCMEQGRAALALARGADDAADRGADATKAYCDEGLDCPHLEDHRRRGR